MSKINTDDLVDLFKEEAKKQEKIKNKKSKKQEKKLEKQENLEFKKLTELKLPKISTEESPSISNFLYDTFFGFCLILLLFTTGGFIYFYISKNYDIKHIVQASLLGVFVISYINSNLLKHSNLKKFTAIIAAISLCCFMIYTLYYFT